MDLRDQLQATLGNAYTLERELGGGGMSRAFVAEEQALARKVVVKVFSVPESEAYRRSAHAGMPLKLQYRGFDKDDVVVNIKR